MPARDAWEQCGQPKGEAGIQNIRKAGRKLRDSRGPACAAAPAAPPAAAPAAPPKGPGKGRPVKGYRLKPAQVAKASVISLAAQQQFSDVFVDATNEWQRRVTLGQIGKGYDSAAASRTRGDRNAGHPVDRTGAAAEVRHLAWAVWVKVVLQRLSGSSLQ